ncbi:fumarate hydratase [Pedobacter sp. SYSU D00535]|uniref:fumarate hydratase n=1 Tax=Pedobacter sp. SYSU D00535 TaxID=2810308 RepID=UPI001F60F619|nr:fumarate hydratase [Pedobacter sp. SYSU D00535]
MLSCKFKPNYQERGTDFLQGLWEEEPVDFADSLLVYTKHHIKFTCDSFYVTLNTRAKVNYYADSCFNEGEWSEYAKGNYLVSNDTLYLLGTFTKSNYKQKLSGCYRIGQYLPVFLIKNTSSGKIELQHLQQNMPVTLKLKKRINCVPQPL